MERKSYLVTRRTVIEKASFPVIDAHNHLWGDRFVDGIVKTMDEVGIVSYCDLTANVRLEFANGGYQISPGSIGDFINHCKKHYPGRFYCFTMSNFASPVDKPLFEDDKHFVDECIATLKEHARLGAKGLKILKELGLHYRDEKGKLINCDDYRLAPVWEEAALAPALVEPDLTITTGVLFVTFLAIFINPGPSLIFSR